MNAAQSAPFTTAKNGAKWLALMAKATSYYPVEEGDEAGRVALTIRLQPEAHRDLEFIAKLWNEFDQALGRKRERKWKVSSVIERFVAVGTDGFWEQVGGRPATEAERAEFAREAVARLVKAAKAK